MSSPIIPVLLQSRQYVVCLLSVPLHNRYAPQALYKYQQAVGKMIRTDTGARIGRIT